MTDEIWVDESPISLVAGAEPTYTIVYGGATTAASAAASMAVYKNGTGSDLASTNVDGTTSYSATGNTLTLKKLHALIGGNDYVVVVTALIDDVITVRKVLLHVQKPSTPQ